MNNTQLFTFQITGIGLILIALIFTSVTTIAIRKTRKHINSNWMTVFTGKYKHK